MSWDPVWEQIFRDREWGKYPPEELVRFVARNYYRVADRSQVKFLELGCGPGANLWYLAREGFSAYGIDGSSTAIEQARRRLARQGLEAQLCVGDVMEPGRCWDHEQFDAVIDVGCLQCNRLAAVDTIIQRAAGQLKPGGRLFSMLAATGTWGEGTGELVEPCTYTGITEGPLAGVGLNHIFSREEVENLFAGFAAPQIEYSLRSFNGGQRIYKLWIVEAVNAE